MANIVLVLGGARSGKSRFAQQLAESIAGDKVLFVATAEPSDVEMALRIKAHQQTRPAAWDLLEKPLGVGGALARAAGTYKVVVVDCLTLLVGNVLHNLGSNPAAEIAEERVHDEAAALLQSCRRRSGTVILVSNEVGYGLVPDNILGRMFRDLLGQVNQVMSAEAAATYLLVAGLPIELKRLASVVDKIADACATRQLHHYSPTEDNDCQT